MRALRGRVVNHLLACEGDETMAYAIHPYVNGSTRPVDLFHLGPQKAGSTWLKRLFTAHPEIILLPKKEGHGAHFFSMHYNRGLGWFDREVARYRHADDWRPGVFQGSSYIRCPWAAERMAAYNPHAKLAITLRNPIDRAFSHWWHEYKKGVTSYRFRDVMSHYGVFQAWIETGFYARHIERFLRYFPREQILCQRFEALRDRPHWFAAELCHFLGVSKPLAKDVPGHANPAGPTRFTPAWWFWKWWPSLSVDRHLGGRRLYRQGVPQDVRAWLLDVLEPETQRLERLLDIDLKEWRE